MKASELRIGNYFIEYNNQPQQWELRDFVTVSNGVDIDEIIKSFIPLTEEWLLRFGLVERYAKGEWSWINCKGSASNYTEIRKNGDFYKFLAGYQEIKYVHQLQNLYYALTGEELEFKN